ncbi:MAG TPA: glycosyltransferase [Thermoanaerobaculia bacterium]|nr:glycosyltransferase [Thermoanaerobaculia bacterium]
MRIAVLTPLPPARTGVAHYASMLIPALAKRAEVRAFDSLDGYDRADFDHVLYHLGNNPYHEFVYREAMREPGVVVLHDLVLHHLIVEMTLARGDVEGYVDALERNHGAAGAAWARGRAAGLHSEMGNFLLPASVDVANRSTAVIVHNRYAKERLESFGVTTPIHVVGHPYVHAEPVAVDRTDNRVIGFFGFLTSAKRAEVVLEAFRIARGSDPRLTLLIVGEPAPNIVLPEGEGIITTGYVADEDFPKYYAAADRLVNLRYPSAGETSGTLIRALDAGKPVAVSDYAQFAELPDTVAVKIPFDREVEALVSFFLDDLADPARAQREWLEKNASLDVTVEGYLAALRGAAGFSPPKHSGGLKPAAPLFPNLELLEATTSGITVKNTGEATLQTRTYGTPEYRLIANGRWLSLPRDLPPGESATIDVQLETGPLRLYHALQDIPMLPPEPFACSTITR